MPEGIKVQGMFSKIASRYDLVNRILSLGMCIHWRNRLIQRAHELNPRRVVDLATGSGDVAFALRDNVSPECEITGYDFCLPMLDLARVRATQAQAKVTFALGDCMQLPIASESVDLVTIAYGVRNFENRPRGLQELHRITQPQGTVLILEFSQPDLWFRPFHFIHVRCLLPILAGVLTGDFKAYRYLGTSIRDFPDAAGLAEELKAAGFAKVNHEKMLWGTIVLHRAQR
jgi:demethylmenaquinone methyltransferase/2-methoxy-6-polyprenyl-1,4-benzoquinol methylase